MKFEAFYKEAYDAEMEELFSDHASETENKPSKDSCDLLMKKADLEFSQYKLVKSEKLSKSCRDCKDAGRKSDIRH